MVQTRRELLDEIKQIEGVEKVALISRGGMFIDGDVFEETDTFSAMSAIILGASETATKDIGTIKKVVVYLNNEKFLIVIPAGKKGVLVIVATEDVYDKLGGLIGGFDVLI